MRLIDADALEEKIENLITRFKALSRKEVAEDYNFVLTVLSTAPTVEAKPVVHAHWIPMYKTWEHGEKVENDEPELYLCSRCNHDEEVKKNYCGFCGAQMDESIS